MKKIWLVLRSLPLNTSLMAQGVKKETKAAIAGRHIDDWYKVNGTDEDVRIHFDWVHPIDGTLYGTLYVGVNFQMPLRDIAPSEITSLVASFKLDLMKLRAA